MKKHETILQFGWNMLPSIEFLCILILAGGLLNTYAIAVNNGKMPVYSEGGYNDSMHFSTINKSEIKAFNLVDIYSIKGVGIASVGDFCMWAGTGAIIIKYLCGFIIMFKKKKVKQK